MRRLGGRFVRLVIVLFALSVVSFLSVRLLPGDPAKTIALGAPDFDAKVAEVRKDLGLDQPLVVQYGRWATGIVTGDLGKYYRSAGTTPADEVGKALPVSLLLVLYTQVVALAVAIPLGAIAAQRSGDAPVATWPLWLAMAVWAAVAAIAGIDVIAVVIPLFVLVVYQVYRSVDQAISVTSFLALSVPTFVLAFALKKAFALDHDWLPDSDWVSPTQDLWEHVRHAILPVVTLAAAQIAVYTRLLRSDMIATLQEDFITMAKSKGLRPRRVLFGHALRPSSLTLLTVAGLNIGTLIGTSVVIERIYNLKGMGLILVLGVLKGEYVATQSFIVIIGFTFVVINFLVDFLYTVLDPRIRRA